MLGNQEVRVTCVIEVIWNQTQCLLGVACNTSAHIQTWYHDKKLCWNPLKISHAPPRYQSECRCLKLWCSATNSAGFSVFSSFCSSPLLALFTSYNSFHLNLTTTPFSSLPGSMSYMGPIPFLLVFFVTLKTVLQTRNFRHINFVFPMPSGRTSVYSKFSF